ncbi:MAG TPA: 2Fe-2S iron-sulfur cluster binding domain-containing protein [Anaerohalosphaeraceae bacterium]|nr:2Fe-2S iron-sulfur cluster binding domain-containing protein [Anaerohalosphaeraceae bacterium]
MTFESCQITINNSRKQTVRGGKSLLATLHEQKIFIPTACGGRAVCGLCKVKVLKGGGPLTSSEKPLLTQQEQANGFRLACQVKVQGDLEIEIPDDLFRIRRYRARCSKIEDLTYDMKRFTFELENPKTIDFTAGQYIQLRCPPYNGIREGVTRSYSIASNPQENHRIDLIIRRMPHGICTTWCFEHLKVKDAVYFTGPYGDFYLRPADAPKIFVAGGSGIAPFVSILWQMKNNADKRKAVFFFGCNWVEDLCLLDEMKRFEQELADFRFVPVVASPSPESGWKGQTGLVTEAVQRSFQTLRGWEGYLCGGPGMIEAAVQVLAELGIPQENIYYDKFA